jgi:hypothetical protein
MATSIFATTVMIEIVSVCENCNCNNDEEATNRLLYERYLARGATALFPSLTINPNISMVPHPKVNKSTVVLGVNPHCNEHNPSKNQGRTILMIPISSRLEVSARYMGRTDCPSVFRLEAIL